MRALLILALSFACGSAFAADARCMAELRGEQARIEREASATAPPKGDINAQQRWSARLHASLEAAGARHEACERAARPAATAAGKAAQQAQARECDAAASRKLEALDKRMQGRSNLPMAEQTQVREEQARIVDERMRCMQAAR